jgi:hypothetical protein
MAVGAYDDDIAAAREAIEEDGMLCQWRKQVVTPIDPDRPWAGSTTVEVVHEVPICFVPASGGMFGLTRYRAAIEAGDFTTFGLMAPSEGWEPELSDLVRRGGQPLVLRNLDALRPAEDVVLYILSIV